MRASSILSLALGLSVAQAAVNPADVLSVVEKRVDPASGLEVRSIWDTIWNDIKSAADCTACEAVLTLLKGVAAFGDNFFVEVLTEICDLSGAEDDDVCSGVLSLEGPIIANDIRKMSIGSKTSELFCITFLGLCSYPAVDAFTVPFPTAKSAATRPVSSGKDPIYVVHYSDIHIDPFYVAGSASNCTKPICCRDYTSASSPGNNNSPAGPYGDHNCDVPISLEDSMYAAIKKLVPDAAFGIFTGDIVDHAVWNTSESQNIIDMNDAYTRMKNSGMLPTIFATAGNHEASPVNSFPPPAIGNESQWVYDTLASDWSQWIGTSGASSVESIGAYSVQYGSTKLRVISLNTNMYYIENFYLYEPTMEQDPAGQFAWLVSELSAAEAAGERVWIIGHMPLGLSDAFHDPSNYFDQIVNRYEATIAAMFFGHTHEDHFQISYSDYNARTAANARAVSYIMPSLTPTSGHPTFRVYTVDPETFGVLDATTYYADMSQPTYQTAGPAWSVYYSAKAAYGGLVDPPVAADDAAAELTPAFWHNVTAALAADPASFDAYYARKTRGWDVAACAGACAAAEVCALRAARAQDNCVVPTPGVHFSKRADEGTLAHHRDECGVSVARNSLSSLVVQREALEHLEGRLSEKRRMAV
nr:phospholipase C [Kionochaeta sp.]